MYLQFDKIQICFPLILLAMSNTLNKKQYLAFYRNQINKPSVQSLHSQRTVTFWPVDWPRQPEWRYRWEDRAHHQNKPPLSVSSRPLSNHCDGKPHQTVHSIVTPGRCSHSPRRGAHVRAPFSLPVCALPVTLTTMCINSCKIE